MSIHGKIFSFHLFLFACLVIFFSFISFPFPFPLLSLYAMAKIFCCEKEKCGSVRPTPAGHRCIQVTLIRFVDPNGLREDGTACDSVLGSAMATSKCDPIFEVCVNDKLERVFVTCIC